MVRLGPLVQRREPRQLSAQDQLPGAYPEGLLGLGGVIETMAEAEGLDARRNAVSLRLHSVAYAT